MGEVDTKKEAGDMERDLKDWEADELRVGV